ncbi:ATP-binding protein [Paenibacillus yanchengensis]|uniref:histidine kinase n=1 Tax=Paenibacillus yanchengensis TaxID=2035833 RepID=A0ABW4YNZ3_9BACL
MKLNINLNLKSKMHIYSSVLFAVLLLLMNILIYFLFQYLLLDSEQKRVDRELTAIARGIQEQAELLPVADLLRAYVPIDGMLQVVGEKKGGFTPVTSPSQVKLIDWSTQFHPKKQLEVVEFAGSSYLFASIPVIWNDGQVVNLQLMESLQSTMNNLRSLKYVLIIVTLLALIPAFFSGRLLGNLIVQPIRAMTGTMRDIQKSGKFKRIPLEEKSKDELVEMGETFNRMIDLLENNFARQESFVSNASHELRTPLTVIESYASLLKRKGLERPELFNESIEAIHSEAIRMREMAEQLLMLAKDKQHWNLEKTEVALVMFAQKSAADFQSGYERAVVVDSEAECLVMTDAKLLKQLLFIFLENAYKYSEETITITVAHDEQGNWLRISDRGMGMARDELEKVFDRFYRVDKVRSRQQGGLGLGLSLAKEIADALHIQLVMDSLEGVGTTVTLLWSSSEVEQQR